MAKAMAKIVLDGIDVAVQRLTTKNDQPGGIYAVVGQVGDKKVNGTVTFFDGGEFDTLLDRDLVIRIFTDLDEQGWNI